MTRLVFDNAAPVGVSSPSRMDVACFVGFVRQRSRTARAPAELTRWLRERGWRAAAASGDLRDVPVPIETWDVFDTLFAWDERRLDRSGAQGSTYLGAAVRSFFAQGGRRCYVVRVGDPWMLSSRRNVRSRRLKSVLPGREEGPIDCSPVDRQTWRGVGHLFGLPDVSMLCLPDLPDLVAADPPPPARAVPRPVPPEQFVECSTDEEDRSNGTGAPADEIARYYVAPRADAESYRDWARALHRVAVFLGRHLRDVQLIAAVPIPRAGTLQEAALTERVLWPYLNEPLDGDDGREKPRDRDKRRERETRRDGSDMWLGSSFLQLAYPWVRTPGSTRLPEELESPDAVLAGVLARNALVRGAFRTAAGWHLADVSGVYPLLGNDQLAIATRLDGDRGARLEPIRRSLVERVCLFGRTPAGLRLLSDVTASQNESYRPAPVHRLVSIVARAARRVGEGATFESSGEALWGRLREELSAVLFGLLEVGALRGRSASEAFQVRCDRTTMTQADIDNGRVIAQVEFMAAAPIELIRVTLAMAEGGQLTLVGTSAARQEAA